MRLIIIVIMAMVCLTSGAAFSGLTGDGTISEPYLINDLNDFQIFCDNNTGVDYWSQGVVTKLCCDLDLTGVTYSNRAIVNPEDFIYIFTPDFQGSTYDGIFIGDDHTISGFKFELNLPYDLYVGVFSCTSPTAVISGLNVEGFTVEMVADAEYISVIAAKNAGEIKDCTVSVNVSSNATSQYCGVICGINTGNILRCSTEGNFAINGCSYLGGICGNNENDISQCVSSVQCSGTSFVGGIVGLHPSGNISDCYTSGEVVGQEHAGGVCGVSYSGTIARCYSVSQGYASTIGEIVGLNYFANVTDCYYLDSIGFGSEYGTALTQQQMQQSSSYQNWDFSGSIDGSPVWLALESDYPVLTWQIDNAIVPQLSGITLIEAQSAIAAAGFVVADVDYLASYSVPENYVITQLPEANEQLPLGAGVSLVISSGPPYAGGDGTAGNPYLLAQKQDIIDLTLNPSDWGLCFRMVDDISLAGLEFGSAVIAPDGGAVAEFTGSFDGNGYKISDLSINSAGSNVYCAGFIGRAGDTAKVSRLTIDSGSIITGLNSENIGMICGINLGVITDCNCSGNITGYKYCGGIVGNNGGEIANSAACNMGIIASASQSQYIGGICGSNSSLLKNSFSSNTSIVAGTESSFIGGVCGFVYATGSIEKTYAQAVLELDDNNSLAGGLCGENHGEISDCYSLTSISVGNAVQKNAGFCGASSGKIENCYYFGEIVFSADISESGNFCGVNTGTVMGCYYCSLALPDNAIAEPLDIWQVQDKASYQGFDFINTWCMSNGNSPQLRTYMSGDIDMDQIVSLSDLAVLAGQWLDEDM